MADMITLDALTEALIWEAGIDGKTGSNARHVTARLHDLLNRQYQMLRSIVTANGEVFFRVQGIATTLPGRADGQDYIAIPYPTDASEIIAVDVSRSGGGGWQELTPTSRRQWRVFSGANRADSPGEWDIASMPGGGEGDGLIAVWPPSLSGSYAIDYVPHWVPITDADGRVFVLFPHWQEWLLTSSTMVIAQRDNNKRNMFEAARDRKAEAQAQIIAHTRRHRRGSVVARRRDGIEL